jgi:hypothetical protein
LQKSHERYLALARAEAQNGNTVAAENYYQHAEHYFRSMFSKETSQAPSHRIGSATKVDGSEPHYEPGCYDQI